jgi:peptidoglycan/LPS O-acetylase OafA/YrhL
MRSANGALEDHAKNTDIEVLRAAAIIFTLFCHLRHLLPAEDSGLMPALDYWGGVDLFFCISGFVIAASILRVGRPASFAGLGIPFWIRRSFRIWPAAILWLGLPLLCAKFFNLTGAFGHLKSDLPGSGAAFAQVENFYFMVCKNHPSWSWPCGRADVYWSLSLEEQFYLVFPFLIYFVRKNSLRVILLSLIAAQFLLSRPVDSPLWFIRTDAICCGVLIASLRHDHWLDGLLPASAADRRALAGVSLGLVASIGAISVMPGLRINVGLLALVSAGLVLVASFDADLIFPWRALRPAMLWIGSRSFAIYLAHNPCIWAAREIFYRVYPREYLAGVPPLPLILVTLLLIGICSEATYRCVETPFRTLGREIATRWNLRTATLRPSNALAVDLSSASSRQGS